VVYCPVEIGFVGSGIIGGDRCEEWIFVAERAGDEGFAGISSNWQYFVYSLQLRKL
jgi:hypothetical protein